ncbi:MAG: hypothetical protein RRC34_05635 [Lentisphaeria bacterium]|nr:hypothetical protein [Lentisphaeria bacterium]
MNVRLATDQDDPALRTLARSMPMPGWVRLVYEREPSFFADSAASGGQTQIIVTESAGKLTGVGARGLRDVWIDGGCQAMGYLHSLRVVPEARRGTTLARGYHFLRKLHDDGRTCAYLTTILESNIAARELLTGGRAGLPVYHDFGRFDTSALVVPGKRKAARLVAEENWLTPDPHRILEFLRLRGPVRQFFPVLPSFPPARELWPGLPWKSFRMLAGKNGVIRGVAGRWNRSATRQIRVAGYAPWLRRLRGIVNPLLKLAGYPALVPPGGRLRLDYAALLCLRDAEDVDGAGTLLRGLLADAAAAGIPFLAVGFHERDPLRRATRGLRGLSYPGRLYVAAYEDGAELVEQLRASRRIPYLELGTL